MTSLTQGDTAQSDRPLTLLFSAGETSGEQHAAHMFLELKKQLPDLKGLGMGGSQMQKAGIDVRYDSTGIAVIGLFEVIKHYAEINRALTLMKQLLVSERPDLLVCVDYKEFNFKLAKFAKQMGIKVLFYVSPQVWAWRPGRVKKYGRVIDMMAVIFPFETAYYEAEHVPVRYVGHPSMDKVHPQWSREEALTRFELNPEHPIIGLLPGSRAHEIERMLPVMLAAADIIRARLPVVQFVLPQAASISDDLLLRFLSQSQSKISVVKQQTYELIQCCDAVMTTSGTATLEVALLQIPMVIVYKLFWMTFWLAKCLVKTPFIGLPNIIAGKSIVKELIQQDATAENIANEVLAIVQDSDYSDAIKADLQRVKSVLGKGEGSKNMADLALEMLKNSDSRSR
ncbi:MAG: lipid-A-disaccharide synthase [Methylicorpusculum sp.]|uniref:lipid-A-disaccharide synthase n=1 Tax=Methylicorpusculum sp. TaxID=2713644 RepID=UPI002717B90D|nr:lipid-A-disaccharide synthase [Methylicorpusculum sp.]MDO8937994.1 lipid-A-disaccharide synthase [Methylicorpusculum sp.]MDP2202801.1 lipid-A-disaccharide synthase [Methylicorpusculum sp.]